VDVHLSDKNSNGKDLLTVLSSVLPKLAHLTKIEVGLHNKEVRFSALIQLFRTFGDLKNLTHITLDLDSTPISILAEGLAYLNPSKIRKLDLNLYFYRRSQYLSRLAQALSRFSLLNILRLKFCDIGQVARADIKEFTSILSSLVSLSSLSLESSSEFLIESVGSALKSLKNLNLLKLLTMAKSTEDHIQQLFSNLKGLSCLQFLHLSLGNQQCIGDSALETLAESLKELPELRKLLLNFEINTQITNKGVTSLCDTIKGLTNLSSLTLNFTKNQNIDEEAVNQIFEALGSLPWLYYVMICLYKCPKLSEREDDLIYSFDALRKAKKFVEGKLDISYCELHQADLFENVGFYWDLDSEF